MSLPARNAARVAQPKLLLSGISPVDVPAKNKLPAEVRAFLAPPGPPNACLEITVAAFFDEPAVARNSVRRHAGLAEVPPTSRHVFERAAAAR
jgi:hypothetical protein